ncbi:MAG: histone deacetylase [Betaproteobacteria bacterium]|jgi:acetoin utilization deacetylase AcuC-like enzyme|nr:histone deacetylase [Betaproteobacteria bacterium]
MDAFYSDRFVLPLPAGHRFPMEKYRLLRERIGQTLPEIRLLEPEPLTDEALAVAHSPDYIRRLVGGDLSRKEMMAIGFPWSPEMVERSRRSAGATVMACRSAFRDGVGINLAGGTHHAYRDRGEGFCCFNDAVVAARLMQREGRAAKCLVIDLDVHQGNGTAAMTRGDSNIFAFSMHGAENYPFVKEQSDLDIELPDGTSDAIYLELLRAALLQIRQQFSPDLVIYLAGADPFCDDRLGRLALTKAGLLARDRQVMECVHVLGVPMAIAMAGGYGRTIEDTVDIHFQTVNCALRYANNKSGPSEPALSL